VVRFAVSYWLALWIGRPLVMRYGKYLLMPPKKIELAEGWAQRNGLKGVFIARLLPVVRHLISIPAGILRMRFVPFSIVTTVGAACGATSSRGGG
jgi:membrane protein DedA with SNARE-associated domain